MPKIHKYKSKAGFYIKSAVNGSMTTYQVTEEGNNYLKSRGYKDQDEIDINSLMQLKDWNYVFTYGQGPGDIDTEQTYFNRKNYSYSNYTYGQGLGDIDSEQTYISKKNYSYPLKHGTIPQSSDMQIGCFVVILLFILIFIIISIG